MDTRDKRKLFVLACMVGLLLAIGTVGYMTLLDVSLIDGLYMTVITISTVGYAEVAEMNDSAKLFSIFIIFAGISTVGYALTNMVSLFVEGRFKEAWRTRKMEGKIDSLRDHYIICGSGETGQSVITQFKKSGHPFVVIDKDEEKYDELVQDGVLVVTGDATHEDVLQKCRIDTAKGLISGLGVDADNVFTVLTAREMNPDLYIVSRVIDDSSISKLKKAGANNTVSPNEIGGRRMAALVTKPAVISFLDIITRAGDVVLDLESVTICGHSDMVGKSLQNLKIPEETGLIVLAIKKDYEEKLRLNPSSDETLEARDTIVVLGREDQVKKLRKMACDNGNEYVDI